MKALTLLPLMLLSVNAQAALAAEPPSGGLATASWTEVATDGQWVGANDGGFWTSAGEHFDLAGKRDVVLAPSFPVDTAVKMRTSPTGCTIVVARNGPPVAPKAISTMVLARYGADGHRLWQKTFGGERAGSPVVSVDGCAAGPKDSVVAAGRFSGCVTFGKLGKRCVDEKLATRARSMCQGDRCTQPFVMEIDRRGDIVNVVTAPGMPASLFAATRGGAVALGGFARSEIDLDPDPERSAVLPFSTADRKVSGHAFLSVFTIAEPAGWLWGRGVLGGRSSSIEGLAFANDGSVWVGLEMGDETAPASLAAPGRDSQPLAAPAGTCKLLVKLGDSGRASRQKAACSKSPYFGFQREEEARLSLFSTMNGTFAVGPFLSMPGIVATPIAEGNNDKPQRVLVELDGKWAIRVPPASSVGAIAGHPGRACVGFTFNGKHRLATTAAMISVGTQGAMTRMIGCFAIGAGIAPRPAN